MALDWAKVHIFNNRATLPNDIFTYKQRKALKSSWATTIAALWSNNYQYLPSYLIWYSYTLCVLCSTTATYHLVDDQWATSNWQANGI